MKILLYSLCIVSVSFVLLTSCATLPVGQEIQEPVSDIGMFYAEHGFSSYESTVPITYIDGGEWTTRVLELIEQAKDYILIDLFLANVSPINQEIYDALRKKHDEGVRIYYLFDASSYIQPYPERNGFTPAAAPYLRSVGISATDYNPYMLVRLPILTGLLDRDHRKCWVFDGETLVLGGINLNYTSFCKPKGKGHLDSMTEIVSRGAVTEVVNSFIKTWNAYSVETLYRKDFSIKDNAPADSAIWLFEQGLGDHDVVDSMFSGLFSAAEHDVWMIQSFAFMDEKELRQIQELEERGVNVHIIYSENYMAAQYEKAAKYTMIKLLDTGADAYMYDSPDGTFSHMKFVGIDDSAVCFGSANYNFRSFELSRELSFVSTDTRYIQDTWKWVHKVQELCRPVTREEAERYRSPSYLFYYLIMFLGG